MAEDNFAEVFTGLKGSVDPDLDLSFRQQPSRVFEISYEDEQRINKWLFEEIYPVVVAEQQAAAKNGGDVVQRGCWEDGYPYEGAIGGGLTYEFSPTGLGTVTKVYYWNRRFSLDLTDYESW